MKYSALLAGVVLLAAASFPAAADEDLMGYANASTYMHAGPGEDFPVITHVNPGTDMHIVGCSHGFAWCDISWNGNRGWIEGRFVVGMLHDEPVGVAEYGRAVTVPTVTFEQRAYWRDHYASYPFYSVGMWRPAETREEVRAERYNGVDE